MPRPAAADPDALHRQVLGILQYLEQSQQPDGEFPTLRHFAGDVGKYVVPSEFPDWYRFGGCPFCTANIAYHLAGLNLPGTTNILTRAVGALLGGLESGVARYVPVTSKPISFPADIDDTCVAIVALTRNGVTPPWNRRMVLTNHDGRGNLYTWLTPRARHLLHPRDFTWLKRDARIWLGGMRRRGRSTAAIEAVLREYRFSAEPAITANVLLCVGVTPRTRRFLDVLIDRITRDDVPLQYYSNLLAPYFHAARLYAAGVPELRVLAPKVVAYIRTRQSADGQVETPFNTAIAALTLMYFSQWQDRALHRAVEYLHAHTMHTTGWLPFHYCNDRDGVFVDGGAELTATYYLEALHRYRAWLMEPRP